MHTYSPLNDLIDVLEQGNRYHISIEFTNKAMRKHMFLSRNHIVHATAVCDALKAVPNGLIRCMRCKRLAMDKAMELRQPYSGYCIHGIYEYCHPVFQDQSLCCTIFIGNILKDASLFLKKSHLSPDHPLLKTMETRINEGDCERIAHILESYILMYLELHPTPSKTPLQNATITSVKSYIDCYFPQNISLAEIAKLYHYNDKYLGVLFKKTEGLSFHAYLNQRRLAHAKDQLISSNDSIMDICAKCGYNNVTYFNRLFKQYYGCTPVAYRTLHTKSNKT